EPVGGSRTRRVDVRVISATNRDLEAMRKDGRFREDLYYRLSVFPLQLPPLRERGEDVVLLAEHFAERYARKLGRAVLPFSEEGRRRLRAYDWPGNVRELANVVERAVITSRGAWLDLERVLPESTRRAVAAPRAEESVPRAFRTAREMESLERENLRLALEACDWRIAGPGGAAERLGLKPSTLSSRLKTLDLRRPD
ncbi:MAG: Fis family transcriptional regulator, partial [Planctomycetota bacterium]